MRTGVADAVCRREAVREISIAGTRVKRKLQDFHTREAGIRHKPPDLICDDAEILRDDRELFSPGIFPERIKECDTRSLFPFSIYCGFLAIRKRIIAFEAAEMVDTDGIKHGETVCDALTPPGIACLLMRLPVIERIAPELSGC